MIQNDAAILQHLVENWEKIIPEWVDEHKQNLTARNIMHLREVGSNVTIDVVEKYDRTGPGAQITAKGEVASTFGLKTKSDKFDIHQIATGFNLNEKDLSADPTLKARIIEISLAQIHEKEDDIAINGDTARNITGVVGAAQANANGKIVANNASGNDILNKGKWAGETGTDIFADVNNAIGLLDSKYKPKYLVGNSVDMRYLFSKDSERNMYYEDMGILFGLTNPKDTSWIWSTDWVTRGKVYVVCKDTMAADFVVSEEPGIEAYPKQPGKNYPIEVSSWSETEIYANEAFVEIAIT
ncbi:MAG: hypothetical protein U9N01_04500 [Euryarchaeota archaeon]|nr:hypothetical protein [Euryarchaeota archaeon]